MTQPERYRALLVLADQGRTMQPETEDFRALVDFIEDEVFYDDGSREDCGMEGEID